MRPWCDTAGSTEPLQDFPSAQTSRKRAQTAFSTSVVCLCVRVFFHSRMGKAHKRSTRISRRSPETPIHMERFRSSYSAVVNKQRGKICFHYVRAEECFPRICWQGFWEIISQLHVNHYITNIPPHLEVYLHFPPSPEKCWIYTKYLTKTENENIFTIHTRDSSIIATVCCWTPRREEIFGDNKGGGVQSYFTVCSI